MYKSFCSFVSSFWDKEKEEAIVFLSNLLAFGAILRHHADLGPFAAEGGRTTAAIAASRHGHVLKVSEDGFVSFYAAGRQVWAL